MKKAFSLIELLIVVIIIGIVYSMAIGTIKKASDTASKKVTLVNLKKFLQSLKYEKNVKILCLDACLNCNLYIDGNKNEEFKDSFDDFLNEDIAIYRYEYQAGMQEQPKDVFFNLEESEEDVCFSYTLDKKGIGEQVFVEFNDKVYDFTLDSSSVIVYDSLAEAQADKEELRESLK